MELQPAPGSGGFWPFRWEQRRSAARHPPGRSRPPSPAARCRRRLRGCASTVTIPPPLATLSRMSLVSQAISVAPMVGMARKNLRKCVPVRTLHTIRMVFSGRKSSGNAYQYVLQARMGCHDRLPWANEVLAYPASAGCDRRFSGLLPVCGAVARRFAPVILTRRKTATISSRLLALAPILRALSRSRPVMS